MAVEKAKYWTGILYPENMRDDWELSIGDLVEMPYSYCIHQGEKDGNEDERKAHVHMLLVFPNSTTYRHAMSIFNRLSAEGRRAINTCQKVANIRHAYDYLIHATETAKKQGKKQYAPSDRICGNSFDIGAYEQLSVAEKDKMCKELADIIIKKSFTNFADFYFYVTSNFDSSYFEIIKTYSGFFERLIRGVYQKFRG